ncbi:MAG: N-formylglutamate amidohydrolase [Chloroflexota bacterium]
MATRQLNVAFESGRLSYSNYEVDLYNSGINQILSVAATHGHTLYHFRMADLYLHDGVAYARSSVLALPDLWRSDPLESYLLLRKIDERPLPLADVDLCFFRADDVRHADAPNLDILRTIEENGVLMERITPTLATCDKYRIALQAPHVPQPATYAVDSLEEAMKALARLPERDGYFVLKDRYGYGCGHGVHRVEFADPQLTEVMTMYLATYGRIILQEFCPEIGDGDLVVTFFDGELLAAMRREAAYGEWRTNYSLGATQYPYTLADEQEQTARSVQRAFPDCRFFSVDMLQSGKVMEVNAFPGGRGLLQLYGISVGNIIMDRLEHQLLGAPAFPTTASTATSSATQYYQVDNLYRGHADSVEVLDVFSQERYTLSTRELVEFRPQGNDFILSIPHSGVLLPTRYADRFDFSDRSLLEIDLFSDILFEGLGGLQVISRLAPFFVDMNRDREGSQDKRVPRHLKNPPTEHYTIEDELILLKPYASAERESVLRYYDLYHELLATLIDHLKRQQGYALLIDAHSMMSVGLGRAHDIGKERHNFVVGTLGDTSAHPQITSAFVDTLAQGTDSHGLALTLAENDPYSGGFITRRHSDPGNNVHVIQIEVTMDTYMYEPVEKDRVKRYALKQSRVHIVQDVLRTAIAAACDAAHRLYT